MAVVEVTSFQYNGTDTNQGKKEYQCYTTDTKPTLTSANTGSTLVTIDSTAKKNCWIFYLARN